MELQALLVLCGLGVAGIAIVLLMGLFSNSGTSYEEAIAQQRKATSELLALAESKNKSKKNSKKAIKKQAKKEKRESVTAATSSEPESEAQAESGVEDEPAPEVAKGHVEFSPAVVVDVQRNALPNVKIRKRGKDPKVKPILVNKKDPSCVSDPAAALSVSSKVTNHFEEMHPKDEFELLQATLATEKPQEKIEEVIEKKEGKATKAKGKISVAKATSPIAEPVKEEMVRDRHNSGDQAPKEQRKGKKAEKKPEKPVEEVVDTPREEVVPPLNAPQPSELTTEKLLKQALANPTAAPVAATSTPPGGKKKKKAEPNVLSLMGADSGGVNVNELVRVVREASLSRTEIQILTEALLNKHHDPLPEHSEWTEGPNDPMQKLKKQLADKEKALTDEIESSQGFQAKLKELWATLNTERARAASVARASEAARADLHALQTRQQRLQDENHALTQDKLMLQSKLSVEGEVQAQRVQMEMHIQRLSEAEAALMQQIAALQAECGAHAQDASAARDAMIIAQQHTEAMAQQLQEVNRACGELEQKRQLSVLGEQRVQQDLRQLQDRLAAMGDLQNEVQRLSARAQAAESNAEKLRGETDKIKDELEKVKAEAEKLRAELEKAKAEAVNAKTESETTKETAEKQKQQLSSEIVSLGEQLAARESELAELKQMKVAPAQNGLPVNDAHKASELALVSGVVEALRSELEAAQSGSRDQREQLARLQDQLAHYQDKNNDLRTKNWKVMEALQSAEKVLQTRSASALSAQDLREAITKAEEAQYLEAARVLRAAVPTAAPALSAAPGRAWLQSFADNINKEFLKRDSEKQQLENKTIELEKTFTQKIVTAPSSVAPSTTRLDELQNEKEYLQGLVDKYKNVIDETEGVLSRLQQNVTAEEQRWAKQLSDKQQELDELRQRTVSQMQKKIDLLEAELAQAKTTNHNHSFADAERLTEERLLAGLSEKLVDKCNGPTQVGL